MIITIDTTQPVSEIDRAILSALLGGGPVGVPSPAHTPPVETTKPPVSPFLAKLAEAAQSAKPRGAMEDARRPVTQQAGVRATPSVEGSDPYADETAPQTGAHEPKRSSRRLTEPDDDSASLDDDSA